MLRHSLLLAMLLGACGTTSSVDNGAGGSGPFATQQLDLRDFQGFAVARTTALGDCPDPLLVDSAELVRIGDDAYELDYTIAFSSEEEFAACVEQAANLDDCLSAVPTARPSRTVATVDLAELMDIFASVEVNFLPDPCISRSVDQCSQIRLRWDELETSDLQCKNTLPWVTQELGAVVLSVITELAVSPE